jgi:predicted ATPase
MGIPANEPAVTDLLPEQLRRRTISALIDQLMGLASKEPLCLIIEDLHWLDPTSRELLDLMVERVPEHRILLLLTARDSFTADWTQRPETTVLRLERLSRQDVVAMVQDLLAETAVPPRLISQIVYRTDGVPLFVEEVGRTLLQQRTWAGFRDSPIDEPEQAIPASLAESLIARLDRSGVAKKVAQAAAVLGRSVRRDVLAAVCAIGTAEVEEALAALVDAGVLERDIRIGGESHTFSHALLRDAAYATLLRDQRRDLHQRAGRALEEIDPEEAARRPEVLAHHLTEAGLAEAGAPALAGSRPPKPGSIGVA